MKDKTADQVQILALVVKFSEYYSAVKKNEILPFATSWLDPEGIMLSEISQTGKDKCCMRSLKCGM